MYAVPKSETDAAKVCCECFLTLLQRSVIVGDLNSVDVEANAPSNSIRNIFLIFSDTLKQKIFKTVSLLLAGISTVCALRTNSVAFSFCLAGFFSL
jgi:hypothetical protein